MTLLVSTVVVVVLAWKRLGVPEIPCKFAIAFWALVSIASIPGAFDAGYSLGEVKTEIGYGMLTYVCFFALARDGRTLGLFLLSMSTGLFVISLAAIVTYAIRGDWSLGAWYGEAPLVSHYILIAVPGVLLGIHLLGARWFTAGSLVVAVLVGAVLVLTGQRAAWFAVGAQLLVAGAGYIRGSTHPPPRWKSGVIALSILACMLGGLAVTERVRTSREPMAAMERDQRMEVWQGIARRISERPVVGAGFGREVMKRAYPDLVPADNPLFWHAHNIVLNYGLSAGVPGMLAILGVFLSLVVRFWPLCASRDSTIRAIGICGTVIVAGVLARNLFNDFFIRDGALLFWALGGSLLGYHARRKRGG